MYDNDSVPDIHAHTFLRINLFFNLTSVQRFAYYCRYCIPSVLQTDNSIFISTWTNQFSKPVNTPWRSRRSLLGDPPILIKSKITRGCANLFQKVRKCQQGHQSITPDSRVISFYSKAFNAWPCQGLPRSPRRSFHIRSFSMRYLYSVKWISLDKKICSS